MAGSSKWQRLRRNFGEKPDAQSDGAGFKYSCRFMIGLSENILLGRLDKMKHLFLKIKKYISQKQLAENLCRIFITVLYQDPFT